MGRGTLFLVVGPSGAGKDTLLDGAKEALKDDHAWIFPARFIDRPADAGGEAHIPLTPQAFKTREEQGDFALSWAAHNLHYGIGREICDDLAKEHNVVINVSRSVIAKARKDLQPAHILVVTAPAPVLAQRLLARGREDKADIEERLTRAFRQMPVGEDVTTVINDGTIEQGIDRFAHALKAHSKTKRL